MSELIERVKAALDVETGVWTRVNKQSSLPFEVIDRTEEPVVLSAWATENAAYAAARDIALTRRAMAVIKAMREPTAAMLIGARDWSHVKNGRGVGSDQATGCWRAMIDAGADF